MSSPYLGYPVFSWSAAPFGNLYAFEAGSSIPKSTYSDKDNLIPNINPVQLDATGTAIVRLGAGSYKFVLLDQSNTVTLWSADNYDANFLSAASVGAVLYPKSNPEITASVVPANYGFIWGDPRRYGAILDGITDDSAALQLWANVHGMHTFPGGYTSLISTTIFPASNSTYIFAKGGTITTAMHDSHLFQINGKQTVTIKGAHFLQTSAGTLAGCGGVAITNSTDCTVEECEFEGMQFSGVYASAVTRCTIRNNYIHDPLGSMQNSGDIYMESSAALGSSSYNIIDGNFCNGSTFEFGIACWDPYSGILPTHNVICNNRIKAHAGYGILLYMPTIGDSYNQVIGNHVQDISAFAGLPTPNAGSGTGIYAAGAGMGGVQIIGNTVQNCCITTGNAGLAPGGIGINGSGLTTGTVPLVIQGNSIEGMTQYYGILVTGASGGATVTGNTIRMPASNTTGDAIRVTNSNNVTVASNNILQLNTTTNQEGIMIIAQAAACTNIAISNNTINGGHHAQIRLAQSGGNTVTGVTITGNVCTTTDNSGSCLLLDSTAAADVVVTGNYFFCGNATVISQTACTSVRYTGNRLKGTGTAIFTTSGVCTSSFFDLSNIGTGNGAGVVNAGTGLVMEVPGGVLAPTAGTFAVGDVSRNMTPAAASVFLNICTTAGSPGTWKTLTNS